MTPYHIYSYIFHWRLLDSHFHFPRVYFENFGTVIPNFSSFWKIFNVIKASAITHIATLAHESDTYTAYNIKTIFHFTIFVKVEGLREIPASVSLIFFNFSNNILRVHKAVNFNAVARDPIICACATELTLLISWESKPSCLFFKSKLEIILPFKICTTLKRRNKLQI